jgi:hypothetical protein
MKCNIWLKRVIPKVLGILTCSILLAGYISVLPSISQPLPVKADAAWLAGWSDRMTANFTAGNLAGVNYQMSVNFNLISSLPAHATTNITTPTWDGHGNAIHPSVVRPNPSGSWNGFIYWMAMVSYYNSDANYSKIEVLCSNNPDSGWQVPPSGITPLASTNITFGGFTGQPNLFYDSASDKLWLFWTDSSDTTHEDHVRRMETNNGYTWTNNTTVLSCNLTGSELIPYLGPSVVKAGSTYYMYLLDITGSAVSGAGNKFTVYSSSDGLSWTFQQNVNFRSSMPAANYVWYAEVRYSEAYGFVMLLTVGESLGITSSQFMLWSSTTPYDFYPLNGNPDAFFLGWGAAGSWDRYPYKGTFILTANDTMQIWYASENSSVGLGPWWTGYTTAALNHQANQICQNTQHDFADVRFTKADGTTVMAPQAMDEYGTKLNAQFYFVDSDNLSSDQKGYMYYGNPTAPNIFDWTGTSYQSLGDNFNAVSMNSTMWTKFEDTGGNTTQANGMITANCSPNNSAAGLVSASSVNLTGIAIKMTLNKQPWVSATPTAAVGLAIGNTKVTSGFYGSPNWYRILYTPVGNTIYVQKNVGGVTTLASPSIDHFSPSLELRITSSNISLVSNNITRYTDNYALPSFINYIYAMSNATGVGTQPVYFDNFFVRKYVSPEPSITFGAQESSGGVSVPTVTSSNASSITATSAVANGTVVSLGGENISATYALLGTSTGNYTQSFINSLGSSNITGAFTVSLTSLSSGTHYFGKMGATGLTAGNGTGAEFNFWTLPDKVTNVIASSGTSTNNITLTFNSVTGATNYTIWRTIMGGGTTNLTSVSDNSTYIDNTAPVATISPGTASASDGTSNITVSLSLSGQSIHQGTHTAYQVQAYNSSGLGTISDPSTGYVGTGILTYQWQRSAADADAAYGDIAGANTASYSDTAGVYIPDGRYYKCRLNATDATQQISTADRGFMSLVMPAPTTTTTAGNTLLTTVLPIILAVTVIIVVVTLYLFTGNVTLLLMGLTMALTAYMIAVILIQVLF